MNSKKNKQVVRRSILGLALISTLAWSSCNDKNNITPPQPQTFLSLLHAAPGYGGVDIKLNGTKVTNGALDYGGGGPLNIDPNDYKISFIAPGTNTEIASIEDSLRQNVFTSAILYGVGADTKVMLITDEFEQAQDNSSAYLRFLQLSPGDESVKVNIGQSDQITNNRTFADNIANPGLAKFKTISSGTYTFTALNNAGDTLGQVTNMQLKIGGAYTLFLDGITGATNEDKVGLFLYQSY